MKRPDIDEVAVERASRGWRVQLTDDERVEVVRRMNAAGIYDPEIAQVVGRDRESVLRIRHRHNIPAVKPIEPPKTLAGFNRWLKETE